MASPSLGNGEGSAAADGQDIDAAGGRVVAVAEQWWHGSNRVAGGAVADAPPMWTPLPPELAIMRRVGDAPNAAPRPTVVSHGGARRGAGRRSRTEIAARASAVVGEMLGAPPASAAVASGAGSRQLARAESGSDHSSGGDGGDDGGSNGAGGGDEGEDDDEYDGEEEEEAGTKECPAKGTAARTPPTERAAKKRAARAALRAAREQRGWVAFVTPPFLHYPVRAGASGARSAAPLTVLPGGTGWAYPLVLSATCDAVVRVALGEWANAWEVGRCCGHHLVDGDPGAA